MQQRGSGNPEAGEQEVQRRRKPLMTGRTRQALLRSTAPPPSLPPLPPPPNPYWRHHPLQSRLVHTAAGKELGQEDRDGTSYAAKVETAGRKWTLPREDEACGVVRTNIKSMERCRRGKMNEKYVTLQSMVPNLFPKAPKARIVDETINYIEELEETIRVLEAAKKARKKARMSSTSSSVDVTISGEMAFFGVRSTWRPGLAAHALQVFDKHQAEVLSATVAYDGGQNMGSNQKNMSLSITAMADETAVEGAEEELMAMLSS